MTYSYQFTKTPVSLDRLEQEIAQSAITIAIDHCTLLDNSLTVYFKAELSSGEQTILTSLVSAHTGEPLPLAVTEVAIVSDASIPVDSDGSPINRAKVTKTGWHYEPRYFTFFSSKYNSIHNRKSDGFSVNSGTSLTDAVMKFYKSDGTQLVKGGEESDNDFQTRLSADCTCTIVDFQPTYDMDIIGGSLTIKSIPTNPAYLWVIVAPDIPEIYGGSVPFINGGMAIDFFSEKRVIEFDGKGAKLIAYDPVFNTNKFRVKIVHDAGVQIGIHASFNHYKA